MSKALDLLEVVRDEVDKAVEAIACVEKCDDTDLDDARHDAIVRLHAVKITERLMKTTTKESTFSALYRMTTEPPGWLRAEVAAVINRSALERVAEALQYAGRDSFTVRYKVGDNFIQLCPVVSPLITPPASMCMCLTIVDLCERLISLPYPILARLYNNLSPTSYAVQDSDNFMVFSYVPADG